MSARRARVHIGCSGWNYKHWRGTFYPPRLPQKDWLDWYARHFQTVEVNNSFYRLPEETTFERWRAQSPPGFVFAVKASRYLTHMKKLRDPDEPLDRLLTHAKGLGRKLGPILYQLPAQFRADAARLETFLRTLPRRRRHVIEFRDPSWYVPQVFGLLERHGVALCLHDKVESGIDGPWIGPFVYVRFHGPSGRYHGSYNGAVLTRWAARLAEQCRNGMDVFAYFNNDPNADATRNATTLRQLLARLLDVDDPSRASSRSAGARELTGLRVGQ